jgi:hypothetical protein
LYDGFTTLDIVGGYESLARIPSMQTEFVAKEVGIYAADTRALGLYAWMTLEDAKGMDIPYVPGGLGVYAPADGQSLLDITGAETALAFLHQASRSGGMIPPIPAGIFNVNEEDAAWVDAMSVAQPLATFVQGVRTGVESNSVANRTYVFATANGGDWSVSPNRVGNAGSVAAVEQCPSRGDELEQDIVVADICGQRDQAELLRLQEQHAILQRTQPAVFLVSLQAA